MKRSLISNLIGNSLALDNVNFTNLVKSVPLSKTVFFTYEPNKASFIEFLTNDPLKPTFNSEIINLFTSLLGVVFFLILIKTYASRAKRTNRLFSLLMYTEDTYLLKFL